MTNRVRKGNDVRIRWRVDRLGEPVNLEEGSIKVDLIDRFRRSVPVTFSVEGNVVIIDFAAANQKTNGGHTAVLIVSDGYTTSTVDKCNIIDLVEHSCEECCLDVDAEGRVWIDVASNLVFPANGKDGIGIDSIIQAESSMESEGVNRIEITLTNGEKTSFEVRNGSSGYTPQKGKDYFDGKSLYDLLVEAGMFTGSLEEFLAAYEKAVQANAEATKSADEAARTANAAASNATNAAQEAKTKTQEALDKVDQAQVMVNAKKLAELEATKQDKLVSGTNIKTINGQPITGEGNINIEGGSEEREPGKSMGYVILSKDKTFAEQVTKAFTVYEIRDKFTLSSFTMPSNCVLKFNGGLLSGSIVGDNTSIDAAPVQIFEDVTFSGVWNCEEVSSEWFGAKSIQGEGTYASGDTLSIKAGVADLPDAAPAINNALALAVISSGKVSLMQRYYKTETTITIPKEGTLNIPQGAVIVPYMNGDGLSVRTVDKTTSTGITETLSERPVYLLENQYIPTDSMKAAIAMSARCCIEGGGTIFLGKSTFTIGILVNGWAYEYKDMTFSPHIHIRTIGAQKNSTASPSSIDLIGQGEPSSDIGNDGQYYYDSTSARLYSKASGTWSLRLGGANVGANLFNTSLRFDAPNGRRIIYPFVELWDSFGFRGVEFITTGDGWINESIIKGSVNEKHGSYFSIFANGGGVSIHHWEDTIMQVKQVDYESNYNTRLFFASKCNEIFFARAWDLSYPALPYRTPVIFEMCAKAGNVRLGNIDAPASIRVSDNGSNNSYTGHPNFEDRQAIVPMAFENLLKYKSLAYRSILSGENKVYYANAPIVGRTFGDTTEAVLPKVWFDDDNSTYARVIDSASGKYGVKFALINENSGSEIKNVDKQAWLEVDYRPSNFDGDGKVFLLISGYSQTEYIVPLKHKANQAPWGQNMTRKAFVPVNFGTNRIKPDVLIYTTEALANYTLDIVNIKLWVDASDIAKKRNLLAGTTANRPDAAPQGLLYYNTTVSSLQIQIGADADHTEWFDMKVPTKLSDLTDDATHRLVTDTEKQTWNSALQQSDISDMETKTHASETYQQKGSYATSVELKTVSDKVDELYIDYSTALTLL